MQCLEQADLHRFFWPQCSFVPIFGRRGDATYLPLLLTPPFVRWRLEIIAKIRHWDRNILSGRETDVARYLELLG